MQLKEFSQINADSSQKQDSIDIPDCYGEFNKKSKLCSKYCIVSIKCCILHGKSPKIDIMEQLLTHNHYAIKLQ